MPLSLTLLNLPEEILGHILSFCDWQQKMSISSQLPTLEPFLHSPAAWDQFIQQMQGMEPGQSWQSYYTKSCLCLEKYGRYIQHCSVILCSIKNSSTGPAFLQNVAHHCINLKSLRVSHPLPIISQTLQGADYVNLLHGIALNCPCLESLSLETLKYTAHNKGKGISEVFELFVNRGMARLLKCLCFTHTHNYNGPIQSLCEFHQLTRLKCQIQCLNTDIIKTLLSHSLKELHCVNDDTTLNVEFEENLAVDWNAIARGWPDLKVAYTFRCRSLYDCDKLQPNPLLATLVLDSLCSQVGCDLIKMIANLYGRNLKIFIHACTDWNYKPYTDGDALPSMLETFVDSCPYLHTLAIAVDFPAVAAMHVARAAGQQRDKLFNLFLARNRLTFPKEGPTCADLVRDVSAFLRREWRPLTHDEMEDKLQPFTEI